MGVSFGVASKKVRTPLNLRWLLPAISSLAVLALVALFGYADSAEAGTFNPELKVTLTSNTPDAPSDYVVDFGVPSGDVNFAGVVSFIPADWGVVKGDSFPIGTGVGFLDARATLGLLNGACNTVLPVHFDFKNSSINTSDIVSYADTDDEDTTPDFAQDKDDNGNFDAVDKYPDFLTRVFKDIAPIRRSAGLTSVAGLPILLQFLIFAPGTEINAAIPHDATLGFPTVTVLTNLGDPDAVPTPGAITDFCSPLSSINTSLGAAEDGTQLFVNPLNGKYDFVTVAVGQRDADDDGYENSLDTCAYDPNVGDPRVPNDGDADSDGIDAACDPNDNEINSDEDLDGYQNRQDNCPLVANGQAEADIEGVGNQTDSDLDQIGDACDRDPDNPDGELSFAEPSVEIVIGSGNGGEVGEAPGADACPDCYVYEPGGANGGSSGSDDDGSSSTLIIVVIAVIAGIVILGGGAALMMRRRGS